MDENNLDPDVVALAQAVKQQESGGNINAQGASGEYGAYQWEPGTWATQSKAAGVDVPLQDATNAQQNQVWYTWAKSMKDKGYGPAEIASMQNAGEGAPDAYKENYAGTNKEGVAYNTPQYVQQVMAKYKQFKRQSFQQAPTSDLASAQIPNGISADALSPSGGISADALSGGSNPFTQYEQQTATPQTQPSDSSNVGLLPNLTDIGDELANNISNRFQQGSQALSGGLQGLSTGNIGEGASGVLQTAGAAAGGVGDILNAGLELIPGVQGLEKGVGNMLGDFANTPTGQSIVSGISQFAQQHPEISGDIGAAINIASVLPMFKGISLLGGAVQDAGVAALKAPLEDAAENEIRNAVTPTVAASIKSAEARGLDPVGTILSDPKTFPTISETPDGRFVYDGTKAAQGMQASISEDENKLQTMLNQANAKDLVNIPTARQQTIKDIVTNPDINQQLRAKAVRVVNQAFDDFEEGEKMGLGRQYVGVEELNDLKRSIGNDINWQSFGKNANTIQRTVYGSLQKQVEGYADKAGIKGVKELNQTMGEKIEAKNILKKITGRTVKQSAAGKVIREIGADVAGAGGELAGNQSGLGFAGTLAGRGLYRLLPGRVPLTPLRLLGRSGRGAVSSSLLRGALGVGTAQGLRGLVNPPTSTQ